MYNKNKRKYNDTERNLLLLLTSNYNTTYIKMKKKTAHAYFGRPYFSKSFGGKILEIWTAFTMVK